jgi:hypothetical protein
MDHQARLHRRKQTSILGKKKSTMGRISHRRFCYRMGASSVMVFSLFPGIQT